MTPRNGQISTKTYLEDTVSLWSETTKLGVVTRTWHDVEDESAIDDAESDDEAFAPLPRGHVQVSFLDNSPPQVVDENALYIIDRSLHLGDVVKRRPEDMMSGIITSGKMKLSLEHTFTGQKLDMVDSEHVRSAFDFNEDQYILYENRWVGQIEEVIQDVTVRLPNNSLVQVNRPEFLDLATNEGTEIVDQSLFLSDKFVVGQHVVTHKPNLRRGRWILGEYDADIEPHGIVVDVRTKMLSVNWLAQQYKEPGDQPMNLNAQPSSQLYPDDDPVAVLSCLSDPTSYQIGDRVRFLNREVETGRYGAQRMDRRELGGFDGNVWMVIGTNTIVDVEWQDGTTSKGVQARDLRMYLNVDEYEGWPGEYVSHERPSGGSRFGIIQSVMPQERVARVRFFDEGVLSPLSEEISLYDLISHPIMQYSLGDHVVIQSKLLPPAGIVEEVVNLAAEFVEGLVRTVTELSDDIPPTHQRVASGITPDTIDWVGEIERIYTDGTVKVRLAREVEPPPDWTGERYTTVGGEDLIVFEVGEGDDEEDYYNSEDAWIDEDDDEQSPIPTDSEDEWEDASEGDLDEEIPEASLDGMSEVETMEAVPMNGHLEEELSPIDVNTFGDYGVNKEKCPGFDILETVPDDHPFKSDNTNRNTPDWLSRIRKEHKILQTSLPEGILVRTYESRLDLIRVLILGPKNTPYENAPFLFDFSLAGGFPTEPPEAFFHSWTPVGNGGRVNPNLYVEGRVCLSLLGTWHSHNDTESWNPKQSTLLQLFLSIQSLVLTARPYYNEAGFATHIGLDESSVNERLYSERAYCLSRGFVKYALENDVEGLEQEVRYLYLDEDGPQLGKAVIEDGKQVIARSEIAGDDDGEWERGRVTRVSRGGLEVLKRTISVLEGLIARSGDKIGS